jgi:MFS family permease
VDLAPLRHRNYRLLYVGQAVSLLGSMITYVALPYQMYHLTGSTLAVGLLGLAELVPLLTTAFVGGLLADAVNRRRMAQVSDVALAAGSATLALLAATGTSAWMLYLVAAWMSAVGGLQRPSLESLAPRLVEKDEMPAVAALAMFRGSVGMIAGPAIGGVLITIVGLPATYLADVVSYLLSLVCLSLIKAAPPAASAEPMSLAAVREGFTYAWSRQELIGTYLVDFVAMVFGMPLALFPAVADRLGGAPSVLGLLYGAPACGVLAASLLSGWVSRVHHHGLAIMVAASVWGLAIVAFGLCGTLWPALGWLAVAGAADAISGIFRMTIWNQTIPDGLRGRLASIEMVSYSSGPLLGHVEAGAVAAAFGVRVSVISGGVLCVVAVLASGLWLPRFVRYDARQVRQSSLPTI